MRGVGASSTSAETFRPEILPALERARIEPLFLKESGPEFAQGHGVPREQIRSQAGESLHPCRCLDYAARVPGDNQVSMRAH